MERTQAKHIGAGAFQVYMLTNHILNGITLYQFVDK
jgi:hypothetical protein